MFPEAELGPAVKLAAKREQLGEQSFCLATNVFRRLGSR
jgi:hypothetical protein